MMSYRQAAGDAQHNAAGDLSIRQHENYKSKNLFYSNYIKRSILFNYS